MTDNLLLASLPRVARRNAESKPIARFLRQHYRMTDADRAAEAAARTAFFSAAQRPAAQRSEHRLVQGSKNPTRIFSPQARLIVEHREWSDEYRIRLKTEVSADQTPPPQAGPRITHTLSERGARAIWDSCDFVATEHGGYTTFLTLTLDAAARERIEAGDSTMQRELSRFLDAITKMRARGWYAETEQGQPEFVPPDESPLLYCWVAENPLNAQGERNPHIHLMMRWSVPRRIFRDWAARLERIWGQGFAHLERLRQKKAAGYYMAKAAGYLTKAAERIDEESGEILNTDQGPIRGNRYGISAAARAPGWYELTDESRLQWDLMGHLIKRARRAYQERMNRLKEQQLQALEDLERAEKGSAKRRAAARRCAAARDARRKTRCRVGRWSVVLKGRGALDEFFNWAEKRGWQRHAAAPPPQWAAVYAGRELARTRQRHGRPRSREALAEGARIARNIGVSAADFERAVLAERLALMDYAEWAEILHATQGDQ